MKILIKVNNDIIIYIKLGIGYTMVYKYTLVIVPNMYIGTGVGMHNRYSLYMTSISYHKKKSISISILLLAPNCVKFIGIYDLIHALSIVPIWGNVISNVRDTKNIRIHDIDKKYKASYPNWSYKGYYDGKYDSDKGGYKLKIELLNSSNSVALLSEANFKHIYIIHIYSSHTDVRAIQVRLHDRQYFSIENRYQLYIYPHLRRTDEIDITDINSGNIVRAAGEGRIWFNRYRDKVFLSRMYNLHTWDEDIFEWIQNKKIMKVYHVKWNKVIISMTGGPLYGVKHNNKAHYNYIIGELNHNTHSLNNFNYYTAYKTIIRTIYKLQYKKYNKYNRRWLKLNKITKKRIKHRLRKVEIGSKDYTYIIFGILATNSKLISSKSSTSLNEYKAAHSYRDVYKDIGLDSRIDIDSYGTWTYVTDQWLNVYYWIQMQLGSSEILIDKAVFDAVKLDDVKHKNRYWYDEVYEGMLYKTSLTRMLAHEYNYYDNMLIVSTSTISSVRFDPIYSTKISLAIIPLYDVECIMENGEDYMYDRFTHKLNQYIVFNRECAFKWWTIVPHTKALYDSWTKVKLDDVNYSIVNSYGPNDTNVLVSEYHSYMTKIASISIMVEKEVYLRQVDITNYVHYMHIGHEFIIKNIRYPHLGIPFTVGLINRTKWFTYVERQNVRRLDGLYKSLAEYNKNKFVVALCKRAINKSIFYYMKQAKLLPYNLKYGTDFKWEDQFVYPDGHKAVNLLIKAKISVFRYKRHWNARQILNHFIEQKKWELFRRVIYVPFSDSEYNTYKPMSDIYDAVSIKQFNKDVALVAKINNKLDKARYNMHSKYGSVPIVFRKTIYYIEIAKPELPPLVATINKWTFNKIVDGRVYENIGNVGTSLERVIPGKKKVPNVNLKMMKKRVKNQLPVMRVSYKYMMVRDRISLMRGYVYGNHVYAMECIVIPFHGLMYIMYLDSIYQLHFIKYDTSIDNPTIPSALIFPLNEDNVF